MSLAWLLLAVPAFAAPAEYCPPLAGVRASVDYCFQNTRYLESADACLGKLDDDVSLSRARLARDFAAHDTRSTPAQRSKLANSSADLVDTGASLQSLLERARLARNELVAYARALMLPGDPAPALVDDYGLSAHLSAFSCFHDPYEGLRARIARLDGKIGDLARAAASATKLRQGSQEGLERLAATEAPGKARASVAAGAAGAARAPASTITGPTKPRGLP
jgi:hypothetical protein